MKIRYLDGRRLRRSLVAACDFVQLRRAELNRINVFPVPDGDTGTNLALTASAIADRLRASREANISIVARDAADAAILGARGNCGMILSHFLLGFSDQVKTKPRLSVREFTTALSGAVQHVYRSLERPVEGTIVTVMRATAEEAQQSRLADFADLVERLLERAKEALARTPEMLPQLRAAGVVDAGAKGFVHMLEGIVSFMHGDPFVALKSAPTYEQPAAARVEYPRASEKYRFCTEGMVRGAALPAQASVQDALHGHGDSLIVIRGSDVIKVHIHTDVPDQVFGYLRTIGELITHKAEDMAAQHNAVERAASAHVQLARRPISIVTDSACDLPEEVVRAHGIHVVPMTLIFGAEEAVRDRVDIDAATFLKRLRAGEQPTTSQPPPAAFLEYYARAAEDGEAVLAIPVGSSLSGTFASAEAAAKRFQDAPVTLVDSLGASLLQGFMVLRGSELAEAGWPVQRIADELRRIREQSGIFFTVDVFDNLLRSGRVGRGRAWLAGFLDVKPIISINRAGMLEPITRVRGMRNVPPRMMSALRERVPTTVKAVRFGVLHVGQPDLAAEMKRALKQTYGQHREIIVAPATPVLAAHLGPGAWGVCYQVED